MTKVTDFTAHPEQILVVGYAPAVSHGLQEGTPPRTGIHGRAGRRHLVLPFTVHGQTIPFPRGWISLHAKVCGTQYKFVTTHRETFSPDVEAEETSELLAGPLNSELPLILACDLNSEPISRRGRTALQLPS